MLRKEVKEEYLWKIEDMFSSEDAWKKEYDEVSKMIDFSFYKGKLGEKKYALEFFIKTDEVAKRIDKLYVYTMMLVDTDAKNSNYNKLNALAQKLCTSFGENLSFCRPEMTSLPTETLNAFITDKDFADYDYMLKGMLKSKPHVLSESEEKLLSSLNETTRTFKEIFSKIDNADLPKAVFKHDGEKYELTHGTYSVLLQSPDRALRKKAYNAYYNSYKSLANTLTATYTGNVRKNVFYTRAKKFDSTLYRALFYEDVDEIVYHNLLKSVEKNLPKLHRYIAVKKKALGLNKMYMYDMYVPLAHGVDLKLDYEDAYKTVVDALGVLGKDYQDLLLKAKNERWIDVVETDGKRSGAYSVSVYDVHPYVLLNYQKTTHDVFTIAHELGHSLHSYFSNKTQPYSKANYTIFVAEVASTVNEVLLHRHLLSTIKDESVKKYLLTYFLEMLRTTLFRQTQFAEFEYLAHKSEEDGEPLSKDFLCETYLNLNKKYYGKSVVSDENISYEWSRIPHFYTAFYVYKYATGIISALTIADRILTEGKPAVDDYFKFLSSGGSNSPIELLKIAGVDLTKTTAFDKAMNMFKTYLDEFTKLI